MATERYRTVCSHGNVYLSQFGIHQPSPSGRAATPNSDVRVKPWGASRKRKTRPSSLTSAYLPTTPTQRCTSSSSTRGFHLPLMRILFAGCSPTDRRSSSFSPSTKEEADVLIRGPFPLNRISRRGSLELSGSATNSTSHFR